jgi:hypothetical protein
MKMWCYIGDLPEFLRNERNKNYGVLWRAARLIRAFHSDISFNCWFSGIKVPLNIFYQECWRIVDQWDMESVGVRVVIVQTRLEAVLEDFHIKKLYCIFINGLCALLMLFSHCSQWEGGWKCYWQEGLKINIFKFFLLLLFSLLFLVMMKKKFLTQLWMMKFDTLDSFRWKRLLSWGGYVQQTLCMKRVSVMCKHSYQTASCKHILKVLKNLCDIIWSTSSLFCTWFLSSTVLQFTKIF